MRWKTIAERLGVDQGTLRKWRAMDGFPDEQEPEPIRAWMDKHAEGSAQAERRDRERAERGTGDDAATSESAAAKSAPEMLTLDTAAPMSIAQLKQLEEAKGKALLNQGVTDKIRAEERELMLERWRGFVAALHEGVRDMELSRKQKVTLNGVIDNAWGKVL